MIGLIQRTVKAHMNTLVCFFMSNFTQVLQNSGQIDKLTIHAIDMCVYLAEVECGQQKFYLKNDAAKIIRFSSRSEIMEVLSDFKVKEAWLLHRSAYDEMVGGPEKVQNELLIRLF